MKINLRSITVMLGLLAIVSIMVPTQMQMQTFASTDEPVLNIREVGNNGNNAKMVKMSVKEGNQPSQKEDGFELDPEENAIYVPQGKNIEITNDVNFFRTLVVKGDNDKQIPVSPQGVVDLKGLAQGFYYFDAVIQDGNTKVAYEAILYIGPRNTQSEDTVNKEINRVDKDVTITKRITNIDRTVVCGKDQKFNDRTKKCENMTPPPCKPNEIRDKTGKCIPRLTPPVGGPTPPITGPGGEKPTCFTTDNKPGRISTNAQTCTPFAGGPATPITGPGQIIPSVPGGPCLPGQTPERNNCVATSPPGTTFPQCITPGNPPNCVPGPDTKPGGTVGTACMTVDGKPGRVAANGACTQSGPAGTPPAPTQTPRSLTPAPQGAPAGTTPGSTDLIGSPCTLPDGKPGKVAGAVGDMNCEPTGVGGATTAPTGPVGSDCALPGGGTGGKVMNTNNGIACVGTPTPRDALPIAPLTPSPSPSTPTDTGQPRSSCTTPDGQPGMMGLSEGSLTCTPIGGAATTTTEPPEPETPTPTPTPTPPEEPTTTTSVPTDPTELANFCVDNPQHSACQTPTTPPDETSQVTPIPEPNVPDEETRLFGEPTTDQGQGTTDMPAQGTPCPAGTVGPGVPDCEPIPPTQEPSGVCESGFGTPPNCQTQEEFCNENPSDPRCQREEPNGPEPPTPTPPIEPTTPTDPCIDDPTLPGCQDPTVPKICPDGTEVPRDQPCPPLTPVEPLVAQEALSCEAQGLEEDDDGNCVAPEPELDCEAQGLVEEDGECVVPDPEVDCEAQGLVEEDGECVMPSDDEADLESDESALDQGFTEGFTGEEDLGNTGDGGDGETSDGGNAGDANEGDGGDGGEAE